MVHMCHLCGTLTCATYVNKTDVQVTCATYVNKTDVQVTCATYVNTTYVQVTWIIVVRYYNL